MNVSIVIPIYNTPKHILERTLKSVAAQSYKDYEIVIVDDCDDDIPDDTIWFLADLHGVENLEVVTFSDHSGNIGQVKRRGMMMAEGDLLLELDHDDVLHPRCLERIVAAATKYPDAGFYYTDYTELIDGDPPIPRKYPEGWGFGFGSETWVGACWHIHTPPVNDTTVRHIVSMPNHARVWRAQAYRSLNGHNTSLRVADDYDLMVRTFLEYRFVHIPELLYYQYIQPTSAQLVYNAEIHRRVGQINERYGGYITSRVQELGGGSQLALVFDDTSGVLSAEA